MNPRSPSKPLIFFVYLFWLVFPFLLQVILSKIPFLNYYYSFQAIILDFYSDFINDPHLRLQLLIVEAIVFSPALITGLLVVSYGLFRKLILILGPIVGLVITGIVFYVGIQGCLGFQGCFAYYMMGLFAGYYWYFLSALLPIAWALRTPADSLGTFMKRTILPGVGLTLAFGIVVSILSYPITQEKRQTELQTKQYKSSMNYLSPQYLPKKVGESTNESIRTEVYSNIPTIGVRTTYACKGESSGYENFTVVEGPIKEQSLSFEELYQTIKADSEGKNPYRAVEKVTLHNGMGIYNEFQEQGGSQVRGARLFYEVGDTRIEFTIYEACVESPLTIRDEVIKIANSML